MTLTIRPWELKDADFICLARNYPQSMRWFRQDHEISRTSQLIFMDSEEGRKYHGYIVEAEGIPVAVCGHKETGEFCMIAPSYEIAYEATKLLMDETQRHAWGEVFATNPYLTAYLAAGFKVYGVKERAYHKRDFGAQDVILIQR